MRRRDSDRVRVGGRSVQVVHRPERRDQLRGEDREVTWARASLFDDQRSPGQTRVGPDRRLRREHRTAEQLVPDRQREAEVDVLGSVQLVVDAVEVGADEDPLQRTEPQVGVRMRERDAWRRRRRAASSSARRWPAARWPGSARSGTRRGSADACGRRSARSCPPASGGARGSATAPGRGGWRDGRTSCRSPSPRRSQRSRPNAARRRSSAGRSTEASVRATSENDRLSAVTSGTTQRALST